MKTKTKKSLVLLFCLLMVISALIPSAAMIAEEKGSKQEETATASELSTEEKTEEEIIELGAPSRKFRFQLIDAAKDNDVKEPVVYLDLVYDARVEDQTVQNFLTLSEELMCLTLVRDGDEFKGLSCISYETDPITEYPERLNTEEISWKVFANGKLVAMDYEVQNDDLIQIVYGKEDEVPQADDTNANRYYFVKNNTVCFDFSMQIQADEETTLAQGNYKLYVDKEKVDEIQVAHLVEAVCKHQEIDCLFDGSNVHIGDYIAEQDAEGNYHFWALMDQESGFSAHLGLGGEWGLTAGSGMHYFIQYK